VASNEKATFKEACFDFLLQRDEKVSSAMQRFAIFAADAFNAIAIIIIEDYYYYYYYYYYYIGNDKKKRKLLLPIC